MTGLPTYEVKYLEAIPDVRAAGWYVYENVSHGHTNVIGPYGEAVARYLQLKYYNRARDRLELRRALAST